MSTCKRTGCVAVIALLAVQEVHVHAETSIEHPPTYGVRPINGTPIERGPAYLAELALNGRPGPVSIDVALVDEDAFGYGTFQNHNQKGSEHD